MCNCPICLDTLTSPIALPCGHVFCHACLVQTLRCTTRPSCPTCRRHLPVVAADPHLIPTHLQPFFQPPLRRVYLDAHSPPSKPASISAAAGLPTPPSTSAPAAAPSPDPEVSRLATENAALRAYCARWRHYAEVQSATHLGLITFGRAAREYGKALKEERDEIDRKYQSLKRKLAVYEEEDSENEASLAREIEQPRSPVLVPAHREEPQRQFMTMPMALPPTPSPGPALPLGAFVNGAVPNDILPSGMHGITPKRPRTLIQSCASS
ncbi:hypothetical protein DENSPDRAFT_675280 [Dentipellis sp. KUC8613]|nr:hypothetical protein DENSPDRAFT_675280 [Dentipellis sp. KUC8613]